MDIDNKYGTLEVQMSLLELLKEFHSFCVQNGIKYSLCYGSLIGAIRHKGFIPWDDDVDIIVSRDEFVKLKSLICNSRFSWDYQSETALWVARIGLENLVLENGHRPVIDVLILDNVPQSKVISNIKLYSILMLQGMVKTKPPVSGMSLIMKILSIGCWGIGRLFKKRWIYNIYDKIAQIGNGNNTDYLQSYNTIFPYRKHQVKRDVISSYSIVPFEDTEVSIMCGYDTFLKTLYGDYMTPPVDKTPKHI